MDLNWLAILAAALSAFVLGGLWYSVLFAGPWQKAAGVSDEQIRASNPMVLFGGAFVLSLVASAAFAVFLGPEINLATGALYGFTAGLCWVTASLGITYLFERRPLALFLINGGYQTLQYTLIGAILGAWP